MDKFIILYSKGLYGAVVGTESGKVLSISKEQLNNQKWLESHTSEKLKVYKTCKLDEISTPEGTTQFLPPDILDVSHPMPPVPFTVTSDRFVVMFSGCFSAGTNTWIVDKEPVIHP